MGRSRSRRQSEVRLNHQLAYVLKHLTTLSDMQYSANRPEDGLH